VGRHACDGRGFPGGDRQGPPAAERRACKLIDGGDEIRWEAIDVDLSVAGLLGLPD